MSPQHLVMARLEIEHIVPLSKGGSDDESNLWLACPICNRHKANKTTGIDPESGEESPLFNPRQQTWSEHFRWDESGLYLIGLTALGRATIAALQMNEDIDALMVRSYWIEAGWHPPSE
ncbi:MAG: HNH endonuclease [Caldilineaceae bacterium]|nr:HNH endonuclease [Caldilineaceae bacterium]